ncbi:hypothetical protein KEG38_20335 [Polyangium jinanense]|uniref:ABC-three component system protein n=1 Tax=Polyangium jinanense TaxID=2829994 RepID=UPI002340E081|nr:ABC-three component system protein [Polyangium jinanense]MDC3956221.1 hypothetical protein [Polyangium jinanense]
MEDLDDVSLGGPTGIVLFQVKNEAKAVGDLNEGFWKALANWAREMARLPPDVVSIREFVFATTAPITGNLPKAFLIPEPSSRVDYFLRHLAPISSDDQGINDAIQAVKALDDVRLRSLLARIRIEKTGSAEELLAQLKRAFWRLTFHENDLESAAREFEGWFNETVLAAFDNGEGARIPGRVVLDVLQNIRSRFASRKRRYLHGTTSVAQEDRTACHDRLFFRQLKEIELPPMALDNALVDFLREQWERAEWVTDLTVSRDELLRYESDLYEDWKHKFADVAQRRSQADENLNGRQLYDDLMDKSAHQLGGDVPPPHVFRGSYHRLADAPHIGWHPRWEQIFGAPGSESVVTEPALEPPTDE